MSRVYFIPGMQPRTGGTTSSGPEPSPIEVAQRAHPEFYAERERRRRQGGDHFVSGFTAGDEATFGGEPVVVEGVEYDQHRGAETTWMRGEKSGTFTSTWNKTADGQAVISDTKRTHE